MKNKIILLVISMSILGCVTIGQFEKMSPRQRANYVCQKDKNFKKLDEKAEVYEYKIATINTALSRGYRVHRHCRDVEVEVPGDVKCESSNYRSSTTTTRCTQDIKVRTETRCTETPVAIDADLERNNLKRNEDALALVAEEMQGVFNTCINHVSNLSAKDAYNYYWKQ